ncbi:hypothetical protein DFAR_260008 [Desulfarculales bacterium]
MALPPDQRGNELCASGPFCYLRHSLYAAFVSLMYFGLALHLNGYAFLSLGHRLAPPMAQPDQERGGTGSRGFRATVLELR